MRTFRPGDILLAMRRGVLVWLSIWSVSFGVAEAAVVVFLRRVWFPDAPLAAPLFPLRQVDGALLRVELAREVATLVMLLGVAFLAGRRPLHRFAAFAFCFGAWDLAYYAALRVAIAWPLSLLDWDVLFLIPEPWAAPVLAPLLVSLGLVGGAVALLGLRDQQPSPLRPRDWVLLGAGGALILGSFFWNRGIVASGGVPESYPWWLFLVGWAGGLLWFCWRWRRGRVRVEALPAPDATGSHLPPRAPERNRSAASR